MMRSNVERLDQSAIGLSVGEPHEHANDVAANAGRPRELASECRPSPLTKTQ